MSSEDRKRKSSGQYTPPSGQFSTWTIKQLQEYLEYKDVDYSDCEKKSDYVELAASVSERRDATQTPPAKTRKTDADDPSSKKDYYEMLGVGRDATLSEITQKYYELVSIYHPAVNMHDPEGAKKFNEITRAYKVLSDTDKRRTYDAFGRVDITVTLNGLTHSALKLMFGAGKFEEFFLPPAEGINLTDFEDLKDLKDLDKEKLIGIFNDKVEKTKVKLEKRLDKMIEEGINTIPSRKESLFKEARQLSAMPYGGELLSLLGYVYEQVANGYNTSFLGLPGLLSRINEKFHIISANITVFGALWNIRSAGEKGRFDEIPEKALAGAWVCGTCEIDATVREACKKVLNDKSIEPSLKENRIKALKILGEVFSKVGARAIDLQKAKREFYENK